jgi:hypothetical protein
MSQPPYAGAPPVPSTDFGPATVSGTPSTDRKERRDGSAGTDGAPGRSVAPLVTGKAAPTQTAPNPSAASPSAPTQTTTHIPPVPAAHPAPGPAGAALPGPHPGPAANAPSVRGPRRAKLQLRHINPWTVLKFSCVLSIALFFVWLIVVGVLYGVLDASGAVGKVNDTVTTINGAGSKRPITAGIVFGGAAIVGVINVVLFIALATIGSVIYNLCADLVGGVELTLSER